MQLLNRARRQLVFFRDEESRNQTQTCVIFRRSASDCLRTKPPHVRTHACFLYVHAITAALSEEIRCAPAYLVQSSASGVLAWTHKRGFSQLLLLHAFVVTGPSREVWAALTVLNRRPRPRIETERCPAYITLRQITRLAPRTHSRAHVGR